MGSIELQILQCLIIDGRMPLRRIGEVVGVSEQTVSRRYRAMRDAGQIRVHAVRSGFTATRQAWTVRIQSRPDSAEALADALANRDDTGWIALTSGGSEVVCATSGPVGSSGEGVLRRLPHTGAVLNFSAQAMLRAFAGAVDEWTMFDTALTTLQAAELRAAARHRRHAGTEPITDADAPLVAALARDGRATAADLARGLDWPVSRVAGRLDALLGGALYVLTDHLPETFGYHACAMMCLTVSPGRVVDVCETLAGHRPTGFVTATTGSANVMATVTCRSQDDLFTYVTEQVGALPGVLQLDLLPYLRRVKQGGSRVVDGRLVAPT
ncbi:Lrp/AsnC family transcriptional regulator [Allobranchiibius sp. GilTou73]|uniref:Lrp/AsnC family transcriptional regulator n=1 Tax=Allobranchiibius sp. GilTou73 TaxID=2904523 RepID=UPI001F411B93|nr:AsnC family transcriptional regulator [Allobranchiibius sp. GilTou73]UIJ33447.1 Lrp/AsnC family transcriptional regulator [Allobranchiibius sp. GilTou73]